jgi:NitT/TauT family transport system permease protein
MRVPDGVWSLVGLAAILLAWEALVGAGLVSPVFFPPPSEILATLVDLAGSGRLAEAVLATLGRTALGLGLGGAAGWLLGLAMGMSETVRRLVDPFVAALHPLPKIALLPLLFVLFGVGELPKLVMAGLGAFFPMLINTMAGVRHLPELHFEVARSYGADTRTVLSRVVVPGSAPEALTGLRLAFNVALLLVLATELVSAQRGLGALIWFSWQTFRVPELYACLAVLALIGWLASAAFERLSRRLVPWALAESR